MKSFLAEIAQALRNCSSDFYRKKTLSFVSLKEKLTGFVHYKI
jgi:hypothetical protein